MNVFLFAAAAWLTVVPVGAGARETTPVYNRYGHKIVLNRNGEWTAADPASVERFTTRTDTIPKFHTPWEYEPDKITPEDYQKHVTLEYVYKNYPDRELKLQIDLPKETDGEPFPYVVLIHGGGWTGGSPANSGNRRIGAFLSGRGIATVRVFYTLAPDGTFLDTVADLHDAIAFVKEHAGELGIDPDRLGFTGSSSGGTLCAYMAMTYPGTKAVASLCGGHELRSHFTRPERSWTDEKRTILQDYFMLGADSLNFFRFSPVNNIPPAEEIPAVLLIHGTFDNTVVYEQSLLYLEALRERGARKVELYDVPFAPHSVFSPNIATNEQDMIYMARFFQENL